MMVWDEVARRLPELCALCGCSQLSRIFVMAALLAANLVNSDQGLGSHATLDS